MIDRLKAKLIISFLFLLASVQGFGQLILDRQVISCFALNTSNADTVLCSTAGQVEFLTLAGENGILTQGFEQPDGPSENNIVVIYQVFLNSCNNLFEVRIVNISGCTDTVNASITWNGVSSSTYEAGLSSISQLEIEGGEGCVYSLLVDFTQIDYVILPCELTFYNFISPNGDGDNDKWVIENISLADFRSNTVKIFNRWGNLVWSETEYNNADKVWNGKSEGGDDLPDGTYFYEAEIDGKNYTGFIELSR